jgi:hypothetical protein
LAFALCSIAQAQVATDIDETAKRALVPSPKSTASHPPCFSRELVPSAQQVVGAFARIEGSAEQVALPLNAELCHIDDLCHYAYIVRAKRRPQLIGAPSSPRISIVTPGSARPHEPTRSESAGSARGGAQPAAPKSCRFTS